MEYYSQKTAEQRPVGILGIRSGRRGFVVIPYVPRGVYAGRCTEVPPLPLAFKP